MLNKTILSSLGLAALFSVLMLGTALAGQPTPGGIMMQDAASPSAERIHEFHHMMIYLITAIVIFVLGLLIFVVLRFNRRANPTPSTTTHHVMLEILWTVLPVVILIIVAIPSFKLLYYVDRTEHPDMSLKVTGYQWYWGYEYPDHGGVNFMSYMIPDAEIDAEKGQVRLLSTDNPIVLPVGKNIQIDLTAADVIHSWAVPALGVKTDTVPGRLNSTWLRINKPGTYFGQCSELCGKDHAYMPIEIKAVSEEEFEQWVLAQGGTMPEPKAVEASEASETTTDEQAQTEAPAPAADESAAPTPSSEEAQEKEE